MDFGKLVRTLIQDRGAGMVIASKVHHDILKKDAAAASASLFSSPIYNQPTQHGTTGQGRVL